MCKALRSILNRNLSKLDWYFLVIRILCCRFQLDGQLVFHFLIE
ncbi:hypothetical protein F383_14351 [Gossypium arboreum]|uniref:Uncharacterized protein n=1 Tax=Gossypium arboreum TaxID=29729 RepID=A0A0B0PW92_GOSAR|nr:hypothetical protein F383_14351 [Gossypium arboreum]